MGERCHQLLATRVLVAEMRHVLEDEDVAGVHSGPVPERRRSQHVEVVPSAQKKGDFHALALALRVHQELPYRRPEPDVVRVVRAERFEGMAERLGSLAAEDRTGHVVHMDDHALPVQHDETVLDALDDRLDDVDPTPLDRERGLTGQRLE